MKICFGIISWLPNEEPARQQRKDRINRLLLQLSTFWPDQDIIVIAQNWQDFMPKLIKNKLIKVTHATGIGILQARKNLRDNFLALGYDYLIMFDDDAIIVETEPCGTKKFIETIQKNPNKFAFLQYRGAQLNGCAISRKIYELEPMVDCDPQKHEAYEDLVWSKLLHYKYSEHEFALVGIKCTQFKNPTEIAPSTWATGKHDWSVLSYNSSIIVHYIEQHRKMPTNWRELISKPRAEYIEKTKYTGLSEELLQQEEKAIRRAETALKKKQADGRAGYYLAF